MSAHNEPWVVGNTSNCIFDNSGTFVMETGHKDSIGKKDLNRAALCVNACAGMSDAQVEMFADGTMDCKACINDGISLKADLAEAVGLLEKIPKGWDNPDFWITQKEVDDVRDFLTKQKGG